MLVFYCFPSLKQNSTLSIIGSGRLDFWASHTRHGTGLRISQFSRRYGMEVRASHPTHDTHSMTWLVLWILSIGAAVEPMQAPGSGIQRDHKARHCTVASSLSLGSPFLLLCNQLLYPVSDSCTKCRLSAGYPTCIPRTHVMVRRDQIWILELIYCLNHQVWLTEHEQVIEEIDEEGTC